MLSSSRENGFPAAFFALTLLFSLPVYALNALAYLNIVGEPKMGALYISLFTVTPIASASILTFRRQGRRGLRDLLERIYDFKRIVKVQWYLAILLLAPFLFLLALGGMVMFDTPIPPALTPLAALPVVILFFFILAAGEEVGWMGYAFERMQFRRGALHAALFLGMIWALWHIPFLVFMMPDPIVLSGQIVATVSTRVIIAWIFINTGNSVFATIMYHGIDNTALVTMPNIMDITPWGSAVHSGLVLIVAVIVTLLWGPSTLSNYRYGK